MVNNGTKCIRDTHHLARWKEVVGAAELDRQGDGTQGAYEGKQRDKEFLL